MPYISPEQTKIYRQALKKALPGWKLSVRTRNYSTVSVSVVSGPLEFPQEETKQSGWRDNYEQVNHFYIDKFYANFPDWVKVLNTIKSIIGNDQRELVYDGDYGSVPTYYIDIAIGQWNKPYIQKQ